MSLLFIQDQFNVCSAENRENRTVFKIFMGLISLGGKNKVENTAVSLTEN